MCIKKKVGYKFTNTGIYSNRRIWRNTMFTGFDSFAINAQIVSPTHLKNIEEEKVKRKIHCNA